MALRTAWKWLIRGILLILVVVEVPWLLRVAGVISDRMDDRAGLIPWREQYKFERYLGQMYDESGVDIRFLLADDVPSGAIEEFSVREARKLGIGRDIDRRGVLFVYDMSGQRLRIEVGPKLEGIFTDAFVGHLMRHHIRSFFAAGDPALGLRITLFILHARLRRAALGQEYDPRAAEFIEDPRRLAVGGGASSRMPAAGEAAAFVNARASPESRKYFAPQPTPRAALQRYFDWLRADRFEADVPLFDVASQRFLATLPWTKASQEYQLMLEYGRAYQILERNGLALVYCTDDPLVAPSFMRRVPEGWQLDAVAALRNTVNYAGGRYTWGMQTSEDQYSRAFADQLVWAGPVLRLKDGDNRPLPTLSGR